MSVSGLLHHVIMEPDEAEEDAALLAIFADAVLPTLPPYEFALYLLLFRRSHLATGRNEVRIGKRSISVALGKSTRSSGGNYQHITEKLNNLATAGFIVPADTTREGTRYIVRAPQEVPAVQERLAGAAAVEREQDYFTNPQLRRELFVRDDWRCHYCGAAVEEATATLDHVVPQARGGPSTADNLVTSCMMCNSIKSGRTYQEAAPQILRRIAQQRRQPPLAGTT